MVVSLKNLIKVAPYRKETRQKLLANLYKFNEDQKYRLTKACWTMLAMIHHAELKRQMDLALLEIKDGKRKYDKQDFADIQAKLYLDFAKKLEKAEIEEDIEEVREKLKSHLPKKP